MAVFATVSSFLRTSMPNHNVLPHHASIPSLRRIMIIHEDRDCWAETAILRGISKENAMHAAYWLIDTKSVETTCTGISNAATNYNIDVERIETSDRRSVYNTISSAQDGQTIIWNISDGFSPFCGSLVACLAEFLRIPYFGSSPLSQATAQNKYNISSICHQAGIPTPPSVLTNGKDIISQTVKNIHATRYFVKSATLGNKVFIDDGSITNSFEEAMDRAHNIYKKFGEMAVLQEFIDGGEIRLTFIDCSNQEKYGIHWVKFDNISNAFLKFHPTRHQGYEEYNNFTICDLPSWIDRSKVMLEIDKSIRHLKSLVPLKDYFTIDFRITKKNIPYIIDLNTGAFLYGEDVEGYLLDSHQLPLFDGLLLAIRKTWNRFHYSSLI